MLLEIIFNIQDEDSVLTRKTISYVPEAYNYSPSYLILQLTIVQKGLERRLCTDKQNKLSYGSHDSGSFWLPDMVNAADKLLIIDFS